MPKSKSPTKEISISQNTLLLSDSTVSSSSTFSSHSLSTSNTTPVYSYSSNTLPFKAIDGIQPSYSPQMLKGSERNAKRSSQKHKEDKLKQFFTDISETHEFKEWQEKWENDLNIQVPFCQDCYETIFSGMIDENTESGREIKAAGLKIMELEGMDETTLQTLISNEEKQVEELEQDIMKLENENMTLLQQNNELEHIMNGFEQQNFEYIEFCTKSIHTTSSLLKTTHENECDKDYDKALNSFNSLDQSKKKEKIFSLVWADTFRIQWLDNDDVKLNGVVIYESIKKVCFIILLIHYSNHH